MSTIAANTNPSSTLARIANAPSITRPRTNIEIILPRFESNEKFERQPQNRQSWLAHIFFALFISMTIAIGWAHPLYSWDLLDYIGTALSFGSNNITAIHQQSYAAAVKYLPTKEFEDFTTKSTDESNAEYRADLTQNAEHFAEQFPYMRVKPLYVFTLYALIKAGIDPVHADVLISCISCAFLSLLILKWLRNYLKTGLAEIIASTLLLLAGILEFAGVTTPDALSALIVVTAFYTIAMKKSSWLTIVLLFAAMLVRADNAPLIFFYLFYAKFIAEKKISWEGAISAGLITIAAFFGVEKWAGFYGWHVHFYHSFVHRLVDPAHFTGSVSFSQYFTALFMSFRMKPPCNMNWFFIAIAIAGILLAKPGSLQKNVLLHLTCICGIAFVVHCIAFPEPGPRFFFGYYLIAGIFFIDEVRRVKSMAWRRKSFSKKNFAHAI
jgi:hypothetical protein